MFTKMYGRLLPAPPAVRFRFYLALLGACFLWIACDAARAGTGGVQLSWVKPTTYSDGSALPATAITAYAIECTFTPTGGTASQCTQNASTFLGSTVTGSLTLTYPAIGGKACWRLRTVTGATVSTDPSNEACKDFAALSANPPTNLTVTVTVTVNIQ